MILAIIKTIRENVTFLFKHAQRWKLYSSVLFWLKACTNSKRKISSVLVKLERRCGESIFQIWSCSMDLTILPPDRWIDSVFPSFWTWMTRARNNMHAVERVRIEFQIRFLASSSRSVLVSRLSRRNARTRQMAFPRAPAVSREEIYTRPRSAQMRLRSIHSPRKILRFAEKLGNFSGGGSYRGILFGRGRGLIRRHREPPPRNVLFRAHICRRTASNFANFLKLGNFRRGYSILLIHFHEFKHPLAFNRSTT